MVISMGTTCRWHMAMLNRLIKFASHVFVDRTVKLLISEVPQGGPADKHTVRFVNLSHQCQSSVNDRSYVTAKDKLVIRKRGFVITTHNPVTSQTQQWD